MNTKSQGNIAEIAVIKEFLKNGFKVSLPYGDNSSYDIIVEDSSKKLYKIQVKSCQSVSDNGCCSFKIGKNRSNKSNNFSIKYEENEVDVFALYCLELDEIYLIDYHEVGVDGVSIRINKNQRITKNMKFREDYIFSNQLTKLFII